MKINSKTDKRLDMMVQLKYTTFLSEEQKKYVEHVSLYDANIQNLDFLIGCKKLMTLCLTRCHLLNNFDIITKQRFPKLSRISIIDCGGIKNWNFLYNLKNMEIKIYIQDCHTYC